MPATHQGTNPGKALDRVLWGAQLLLALVFLAPVWSKLVGAPVMIELFRAVGVGQWLRYVTGVLELTGIVLILVPKTTSLGALLLATVMLGAVTAHLVILHIAPTTPAVLLLLAGFVVWGRRQELALFAR